MRTHELTIDGKMFNSEVCHELLFRCIRLRETESTAGATGKTSNRRKSVVAGDFRFSLRGAKYYSVIAYFDSVDGLREGADIEIAGVPVGRVSDISLAPEGQARLEMRISKKVELAEDTIASVAMRGLMGDKVIKLLPDGSPLVIEYGGIL